MTTANPFAFSEYIQNKPSRNALSDSAAAGVRGVREEGTEAEMQAGLSGTLPPETAPHTVSVRGPNAQHHLDLLPAPRLDLVPPPTRRLPRYTRAKASWRPPLVLQERDIQFLKTIAEYRLLSTPQFLQLFPESRDGVYRRLQGLFHHGYLDRLKGDPTTPMVYALGKRGAEVLAEREVLKEANGWGRKNKDLRDRYVAHQAMVANFRIALTLATRERPDVRLLFFHREGHALRDQVTATYRGRRLVLPINPDGFFGLQFPTLPEGRNRTFFFVEADRSTMSRQRFLQKLVGYGEWYSQGGHTKKHGIRAFRVLTVTKSEARMESLLQITHKADAMQAGSAMFWFTSVTSCGPTQPGLIFQTTWRRADRPGIPATLLPEKSGAT